MVGPYSIILVKKCFGNAPELGKARMLEETLIAGETQITVVTISRMLR